MCEFCAYLQRRLRIDSEAKPSLNIMKQKYEKLARKGRAKDEFIKIVLLVTAGWSDSRRFSPHCLTKAWKLVTNCEASSPGVGKWFYFVSTNRSIKRNLNEFVIEILKGSGRKLNRLSMKITKSAIFPTESYNLESGFQAQSSSGRDFKHVSEVG